MRTSTLIGVGIGGAALFALWHLWAKKAVAVAQGNAASVAQQAKSVASSTIAARETVRNSAQAKLAGVTVLPRKGASIQTGFQGAYGAGMALKAGSMS